MKKYNEGWGYITNDDWVTSPTQTDEGFRGW